MQEQYDDIGEILAKYPQITLEQDAVLKDWINQSDANRKIFEELSSPDYLVNELQLLEQINEGKTERWRRVQEALTTKEAAAAIERKITWWHRWKTYVAAASVILIIGIFFYTWQGRKQNGQGEPAPTVVKVNDASPGKYKAKLKLADGSEVILDSATNEVLAQQGGMRIVNKDGRLVYEKTGQQNEVLYNTLYTSKGESYATELSDGTRVWLNSQSSVRYPVVFNGDLRRVEITGEAYFEVAKNPKQPFIVMVNGMEVQVLGTHFNINSYADEPTMKTTLLEGKVKVRSAATNAQAVLTPGEQAILRQTGDNKTTLSKTNDVDADAEVAWRFGYFNFSNTDFETLMRQLQRWYDVEVVYQGDVPDVQFFGKIPRAFNLSQVLNTLQRPGVHFKVSDKKIIVLP